MVRSNADIEISGDRLIAGAPFVSVGFSPEDEATPAPAAQVAGETAVCVVMAISTTGRPNVAIGSTSSMAKAPANKRWRSAARLRRASSAANNAIPTVTVAFTIMEAVSELPIANAA